MAQSSVDSAGKTTDNWTLPAGCRVPTGPNVSREVIYLEARMADSSALRLLSAALDSARHHGGALMIWPDDQTVDSIDFRLSLLPGHFQAAAGFDSTYTSEMRFDAFAIQEPTITRVLPIMGQSDAVYPHMNALRHVTGQVIALFVVDTTGHAVMSTFRDDWPADKPRLTGEMGRYYDEFVDSIRNYAAKARFVPASIGGCPVPQLLRMPVSFQGPHYDGAYTKSH